MIELGGKLLMKWVEIGDKPCPDDLSDFICFLDSPINEHGAREQTLTMAALLFCLSALSTNPNQAGGVAGLLGGCVTPCSGPLVKTRVGIINKDGTQSPCIPWGALSGVPSPGLELEVAFCKAVHGQSSLASGKVAPSCS